MSVRKREGSPFYQYDFTVGGTRFRGSTEAEDYGTAQAVEKHLRTKAILDSVSGKKPTMTLNAALEKYWNEHGQHCASAWSSIDLHSRHLIGHFGTKLYLHEIDDAQVNAYIGQQRTEISSRKKPVSNATINRRLELLRTVLNKAKRQWGVEAPDTDISRHMLKEPEARTRWITPEEADKLILAAAPHLKAPIRCALLTGLRLDNIVSLQWQQVDLKNRLITVKVKSSLPGRKSHEVPISDSLFSLLLEQSPQKTGHVFLRQFKKEGLAPTPIKKFRRSFRTACKKAGIEDFRFHDLRHTAASWMIQNGVPLDVVKEVLGHSDISMTMKYAHRDTKDKFDAMERLATSGIRHIGKRRKNHA